MGPKNVMTRKNKAAIETLRKTIPRAKRGVQTKQTSRTQFKARPLMFGSRMSESPPAAGPSSPPKSPKMLCMNDPEEEDEEDEEEEDDDSKSANNRGMPSFIKEAPASPPRAIQAMEMEMDSSNPFNRMVSEIRNMERAYQEKQQQITDRDMTIARQKGEIASLGLAIVQQQAIMNGTSKEIDSMQLQQLDVLGAQLSNALTVVRTARQRLINAYADDL